MDKTKTLAVKMAELSETRQYRSIVLKIKKLSNDTNASRRHLVILMPSEDTLKMLLEDGFSVVADTSSNTNNVYTVSW